MSLLRCQACGTPLLITKACCPKHTCMRVTEKKIFASPLAYIDKEQERLILAFISHSGHLGLTAEYLGYTKRKLKEELAKVQAQLQKYSEMTELALGLIELGDK